MFRHIHHHFRHGYFFGYVTGEGSGDMIPAVTGEEPKVIGEAVLEGFELRIQQLGEIARTGENPQEILRSAWGNAFRSYVLVKKPGSQVEGVLLRLSLKARHKLDNWELVPQGWSKREFVEVTLSSNGKRYWAETQVLEEGQDASQKPPLHHRFWLMSKKKFLRLARLERSRSR